MRDRLKYHYDSLDTLVPKVKNDCDKWLNDSPFGGSVSKNTVHWAKVALTEWTANLVKHADFEDEPSVVLMAWADGETLKCQVVDNSSGFDFEGELESCREPEQQALPERGMGLMLICESVEDYRYEPIDDGERHRLTISVCADEKSLNSNGQAEADTSSWEEFISRAG